MKTDNVNHPRHYSSIFCLKELECIDITEHLDFCRGNSFKYVWRAGSKGDKKKKIEDLKKAIWYLKRFQKRMSLSAPCESIMNASAVRVLFSMIVKPETPKVPFKRSKKTDKMFEARRRYDILESIVHNCISIAISQIEDWIKEIQKDERSKRRPSVE